jgi:hypothetical protein
MGRSSRGSGRGIHSLPRPCLTFSDFSAGSKGINCFPTVATAWARAVYDTS